MSLIEVNWEQKETLILKRYMKKKMKKIGFEKNKLLAREKRNTRNKNSRNPRTKFSLRLLRGKLNFAHFFN